MEEIQNLRAPSIFLKNNLFLMVLPNLEEDRSGKHETFALFEKKISEEISELQSLALLIVRPGQLCGEIDWKMPFPGIILLYFGHFHQILGAH